MKDIFRAAIVCVACILQATTHGLTPKQKMASLTSLETIDVVLLQEVTAVLSERFKTNVQIQSMDQLSESDRRNLILRIKLVSLSKEVPKSVILKQSLLEKSSKDDISAFGRFTRDWAGLEFLNNLPTELPLTPRFYGGSSKYRFVLIEDLGEKHISLVDSLLATDANAAISALKRFMRSLGKLHAMGHGNTRDYLKILESLGLNAESADANVTMMLEDLSPKIESLLRHIGVSDMANIRLEMNHVISALLEPGPFTTLIHGDMCPDNVFDDCKKNELRFIDFEWASVRSALLDGTYLRMSMPTCWCAYHVPENLIEPLEALYREELIKKIPAAKNDQTYYDAYTNACAFWMLQTTAWMHDALEKEECGEKVLSRVLSRLTAFIEVSKRHEKLPYLRMMAEGILDYLQIHYPETKPLDMYPAFNRPPYSFLM